MSQGHDMNTWGDVGVLRVVRMEACPVPCYYVFLLRILLFDLLQEGLHPQWIRAGGLHAYHLAVDHVQGSVAVAPLLSGLIFFVRAKPSLRPAPPIHREQTETAFIGKPHPNPITSGQGKLLEYLEKVSLERFRFGRVPFLMHGARDS